MYDLTVGRDVICPDQMAIDFVNKETEMGITHLEPRDGITYHLCDLPGHNHHVPVAFGTYGTCYDRGAFTWEGRYSRW